jgi:hypothetical protein
MAWKSLRKALRVYSDLLKALAHGRAVVIVKGEDGKWPEDQVETISDFIDQWESGHFNIMYQAVHAMLDALAEGGEG